MEIAVVAGFVLQPTSYDKPEVCINVAGVNVLQGMHELLAPLIFVLHCDHQAFLHACELENVR